MLQLQESNEPRRLREERKKINKELENKLQENAQALERRSRSVQSLVGELTSRMEEPGMKLRSGKSLFITWIASI